MNFLAHIALSGNNEDIVVGNFTGDYVKGVLNAEKEAIYGHEYILGVKLHRFIDDYTDTDSSLKELAKILANKYGRSSAIGIDLLFDFFLASEFEIWHHETLMNKVETFHNILHKKEYLIPDRMQSLVRALIKNNWIGKYNELNSFKVTVVNMSKYHPFLLPLEELFSGGDQSLDLYKEYFLEFYPRLQQSSSDFLFEQSEKLRIKL